MAQTGRGTAARWNDRRRLFQEFGLLDDIFDYILVLFSVLGMRPPGWPLVFALDT